MNDHDIFLKQRTKLLGISIVLWLYECAGLSFENIHILGTDIPVKHPVVLTVGIWLAGFYWFIRFHQYSNCEMVAHMRAPKRDFWRGVEMRFEPMMQAIAGPLVKNNPNVYLNDRVIEAIDHHQNEYAKIEMRQHVKGDKKLIDILKVNVRPSENLIKEFRPWRLTYKLLTIPSFKEVPFAVDFIQELNNSISGPKYQTYNDFKISLTPFIIIWVKSIYHFIFISNQFSQYVWPYLAFIIALSILFYKIVISKLIGI